MQPIELHAWPTPNGYKISIMLEECDLPYTAIPVNIGQGDQFKDDFLKISPNNKMPAIIDPDGPDGQPVSVFESGAILSYLAGKTGRFFGDNMRERMKVMEWLMWQMAGFGPMLGQAHHFRQYAPEKIDYAYDRYTNEAKRLYGVLNKQLGESTYLAGEDYTIADIATWPWAILHERQGIDVKDIPNVVRWIKTIEDRPAVQKGMELMKEHKKDPAKGMSDEERDTLFGNKQYAQR